MLRSCLVAQASRLCFLIGTGGTPVPPKVKTEMRIGELRLPVVVSRAAVLRWEIMSAPLTDDDKAFIRAILDHPEALITWLVYADWLDDRDDPRAEFLRLSVERRLSADAPGAEALDARLAVLRDELDPNWMLVFDTVRLSNCRGAGWVFQCPLSWDQLSPTDQPDIRVCHACKSPVFFCHTADEARQYASCGQCVAISTRAGPVQLPGETGEFIALGMPRFDPDEDYEMPPDDPPPARRPWWKFW